ncbi:MAG: aldehyde dehydrogenase family protein [Candidatus Omnitrophica bacterium]|nr:aldehyde dehydrogenase family protein [Candidatus Omnitrophota bacterium]
MMKKFRYSIETTFKKLGSRHFNVIGPLVINPKSVKLMTIRQDIQEYSLFIDGKLTPADKGSLFDSFNPSTGKVFARVAKAQAGDLDLAVKAARKAFDQGPWPRMSLVERGIYLKRLAGLIRKEAKELALLECLDTGKTIKQTTFIDINTCAETFEYFSNVTTALDVKEVNIDAPVHCQVSREPYGVVGCIIPWNYPLIMTAWKMAPALMAGNTVVFKPSPLASVSVARLGEILARVGFPDGAVNVVTSDQIDVAKRLVEHEDVDLISFTGGTETGLEVVKSSAKHRVKKTILELGGKSPNIVFADCDLEAAVGGTLSAIFMNQGAMCTAGSRLFIEESIYDEFLKRLVERTKKLKVGPADQHTTDIGPLISHGHLEKTLAFVERAKGQGAKVDCGGEAVNVAGAPEGFYFAPTILGDIDHSSEAAQSEIFSPLLYRRAFQGEEEVVALANATKFGLAASIWTKDLEKANRVTRQLKCGTVWINTYGGFYNEAPYGGFKQSGVGRELGEEGLNEFTQTKNVITDQTPGGKPLVTAWFG